MALSSAELLRIEGAISSSNLIRIAYSKKKQPNERVTKRVVRVVEPYEIKEKDTISYLWACDSRNGAIKSFNIENIKSARLLPQTFQPRTF